MRGGSGGSWRKTNETNKATWEINELEHRDHVVIIGHRSSIIFARQACPHPHPQPLLHSPLKLMQAGKVCMCRCGRCKEAADRATMMINDRRWNDTTITRTGELDGEDKIRARMRWRWRHEVLEASLFPCSDHTYTLNRPTEL
jgi:hypothetical protein